MADLLLRSTGTSALAGSPPFVDKLADAIVRGASKAALELAVVERRAEFEGLEHEWNELFHRVSAPHQVFQSFAWNWHWSRHYLSPDMNANGPRLAIVTGRMNGRLVLIMPFVTEHRLGLTELRWMGEPVSQYGDVVAAPEAANTEALTKAWRFALAATGADLANLRKVRTDASAAPLLDLVDAKVTATEEAPFVDLSAASDYATYENGLSAKARKNRRRQRRRLEDLGPVTFECHTETDRAAELAREAIELKRDWLNDKDRISTALSDDRFAAFFSDVAHGRGKPTGCKVLTLQSGGRTAAINIGIDHAGSRFLHLAVYRRDLEKCAAGSLLFEDTIASSFVDGLRCLDFLAPGYDYKMDFADRTVLVRDHAAALSLRGKAYVNGFLAMRRKLKGAVERLPAPARRTVARILQATAKSA